MNERDRKIEVLRLNSQSRTNGFAAGRGPSLHFAICRGTGRDHTCLDRRDRRDRGARLLGGDEAPKHACEGNELEGEAWIVRYAEMACSQHSRGLRSLRLSALESVEG